MREFWGELFGEALTDTRRLAQQDEFSEDQRLSGSQSERQVVLADAVQDRRLEEQDGRETHVQVGTDGQVAAEFLPQTLLGAQLVCRGRSVRHA